MPDTDTPIPDSERGPPSGDLAVTSSPFWVTKSLQAMSRDEWESLCDRCGQCCLLKVEDEDSGKVFLTELACRLLDVRTCRCGDYANRHASVPDCIVISPDNTKQLSWLPDTCEYARVGNGLGLEWWHALVSGDPDTVHHAGISVRGWARSEVGVPTSAIAKYIVGEAG